MEFWSSLRRAIGVTRPSDAPLQETYSGPASHDIVFFCSSHVDEIWVRSTAYAAQAAGYSCAVAITDDASALTKERGRYNASGIDFQDRLSFKAAAELSCTLMITASSGINRQILPTGAKHLVHMPHSLASLHMIYPGDAFHGYDVLFSCGPHHDAEFTAIYQKAGLVDRRIFPVGYGKLDVLYQALPAPPAAPDAPPHVLIAPSWGPSNLLEAIGLELAETLLTKGWRVTVRPHPLLILEAAPVMDDLEALQDTHELFALETDMVSNNAMLHADLLIGDYSGTSFEFSALRNRPVVFADVGKKVVNPDWQTFDTEPIEITLRSELGAITAPHVTQIASAAERCLVAPRDFSPVISRFLHRPPGQCAGAALKAIEQLMQEETSP